MVGIKFCRLIFPPGEKYGGGNNWHSMISACQSLFTSGGIKWLIRQFFPPGEETRQIWTPSQALSSPSLILSPGGKNGLGTFFGESFDRGKSACYTGPAHLAQKGLLP